MAGRELDAEGKLVAVRLMAEGKLMAVRLMGGKEGWPCG